jgi:uridine phosphorylase
VSILFIAADHREAAPWTDRWEQRQTPDLPVHWARGGVWRGQPMLAIANGAGWKRADLAVRAALDSGFRPRAVFNIGFCGALDPSLKIGDVFVATEVHSEGRRYPASRPAGPDAANGVLASISHIAETAAEKRQLRESGAIVVEMEAAAVARASEQIGIPFFCVRSVSDLAEEDFANHLNVCLMADGRMNIPRLVFGAFGSPVSRFGELIRLARRSARASKNLGDFLANCNY